MGAAPIVESSPARSGDAICGCSKRGSGFLAHVSSQFSSVLAQITRFFCVINAVGDPLQPPSRRRHVRVSSDPFSLIKELWIPAHTGGTNVPLVFSVLELLVIIIGKEDALLFGFSGVLALREGEVPSPRIETVEIHERLNYILEAEFATLSCVTELKPVDC